MSRTLAVASLLLPTLAIAETRGGISEHQIDAPSTHVIGGSAVPAGKWPDAVAVVGAQGSCTGTLIAPDIVLTAGHCADAGLTQVIANTTNYNGAGGVRSQIASITAYPNWETTFDIAVIKLTTPITTVTPRPVGASCTFQGFSSNMMVHLVGFGLTDTAGQGNNTELREATAPVTDPTCAGTAAGCSTGAAPAGEFIAGGNGTDSCFGDSGGPVYLDTPRGTMVIAAVSRGLDNSATPCGGGGIYVRTDKVLQWIEQTAGKPVSKDSCAGGGVTPPPDPSEDDEENPPPGGGDPQNPDDNTGTYGGEITGGCSTNGSSAASLLLGLALLGLRRRR
jgi:secreted trypsin-like serine protease